MTKRTRSRWLLCGVLAWLLAAVALPGCSGDTGPKLDTSKGGGPGMNAPLRGGKPGERPQRPIGA